MGAILTLVTGAGCGGSSEAVQSDFVEACTASSNLGDEVCACMAEKAEQDLSDEEREFVVATLREDMEKAADLRSRSGVDGASRPAGPRALTIRTCADQHRKPRWTVLSDQ